MERFLSPDAVIFKSGLPQFLSVKDIAAVKNQAAHHFTGESINIRHTQFFPLGDEHQGITAICSLIHVVTIGHSVPDTAAAFVHGNRIIYFYRYTGLEQQVDKCQRRCLAHVICLGLECKSPQADGFTLKPCFVSIVVNQFAI